MVVLPGASRAQLYVDVSQVDCDAKLMIAKFFSVGMLTIPMALVTTACVAGQAGPQGALNETGDLIYVANQGAASVTVLDGDRLEVVEVISLTELGFSPNARPHHIAIEPDGSAWYVSLIGENRVLKFNSENELLGQAEFEVPGMLAVAPGGGKVYIGRSMMAVSPPQRIGVLDAASMEVEELDVFFPRPHAIAVHPNGEVVFTASLAVNQLAALELSAEVPELLDVEGDGPLTFVQFAVSPNGQVMIGTAQLAGELLVFDISDPLHPELRTRIEVPAHPWHPVISSDGRRAFFGNKEANAVTVIDLENDRVERIITGEGIAQPHGSALSSDGRHLYVSNNNSQMPMSGGDMSSGGGMSGESPPGLVVVIDTETLEVIRVIPVASNATGLAVRPGRPTRSGR